MFQDTSPIYGEKITSGLLADVIRIIAEHGVFDLALDGNHSYCRFCGAVFSGRDKHMPDCLYTIARDALMEQLNGSLTSN